jgi:hypothetical protein
MMMKRLARLLFLAALLPLAAHAQGVRDANGNVVIRDDVAASRGMDPRKPFFTMAVDGNGNYVAPGGGGTGGSGNAATTSNATDGQATSTTNQQNVTYNYLYNGTTWDRARGVGGAANVLVGGTLPAFAVIPTFTLNQATPGTTNAVANQVYDGTTWRPLLSTTTGALEPPTAASGKMTVTSTDLTANTSTTIAAANTNRISLGIQCASGAVNVSETGATLAAATFGAAGASIFIPSGTAPYFTPPIATRTAVTAYTATAQKCVVTEYLR